MSIIRSGSVYALSISNLFYQRMCLLVCEAAIAERWACIVLTATATTDWLRIRQHLHPAEANGYD